MKHQRISHFFAAGFAALLLSMTIPGSPANVSHGAFLPANVSTSVTLGRPTPFTDLQDLQNDTTLNAIKNEIAAYCQLNSNADADDIKQHLVSTHESVVEDDTDEEYYSVVTPDGTVRTVCTSTMELSVSDPGQIIPVKVWISETVDV